jgi:tripartite-type tricarboxylate transporter receptor subunit TctC
MLKGALAGAALAVTAGSALAEYPEKPVNFIVPWPPGDLEDVLTRMIAEDFQKEYGVAAAVVNKPGGGGGPLPGRYRSRQRSGRWLYNRVFCDWRSGPGSPD